MRHLLSLTLIATLMFPTVAGAEECDGDTCIEVSASDENHLVIRVKKGKPGSITTSSPSPKPTSTSARRRPWIPWLPKPQTSPSPRPKTTKSSKPRPKKPKIEKIEATELVEQVQRMLPGGVIITQPSSAALLREPVNFITTVPASFQTVIVLLEVPILITLRATYRWDFGDGNTQISQHPGAPYPLSIVTNRYKKSGDYQVALRISWSGTWKAGPISGPINGNINQNFQQGVRIHGAETTFTK